MNQHTYRVLEYIPVRELIALKTTNIYGREHIEEKFPMENIEDIKACQQEVTEALSILDSQEPFTVGDLGDIRSQLVVSRKKIPLQPKDILEIYECAVRTRLLQSYLSMREALTPMLCIGARALTAFPDFEKSVKKSIDSDGTIMDSASAKLETVRKSVRSLKNRIQSQLETFIRNPDYLKMLQEPIITQREHRYVVPVKQEYRGSFPGLVLDSSASGATLFMEPLTVLKLTNELKYQESEEKHEEEQIRLKLTAQISAIANDLSKNLEFAGHYDALQAAARFWIEYDCVMPGITGSPLLDLKNARHPLLGEKAVPIDIRVGEDFKGLVITGPNTGGKTVTLKTAGLLAMMAMSGFPIPASEGSRVGIFRGIYADIGDEQSISQNLSTFSSHIANITRVLPHAGGHTLALLDEIGAGTDPSEGVALASGILNYLIRRKTCVIVTTHYNELKVFASKNEDFINAAVEFNEETLEPSYRLQIGLPGRSCALKIAERLGIPGEILMESKELMGREHFHIESLLSEIDKEKSITVKEREVAEESREEMERLREEYEQKLSLIDSERDKIIDEARAEARELVYETLRELDEARNEWRKSLKDFRENRNTRQNARMEEKSTRSRMEKILQKLDSLRKKEKPAQPHLLPIQMEQFVENTPVKVSTIGRAGRIIRRIDDHKALVQLENVKMEIPYRDLEILKVDLEKIPEGFQPNLMEKVLNISDKLDIRGTRADEGISILEKYLDDALLTNLEFFSIIHGKGTGALRNSVHDFLKNNPRIKSFRDGDIHEGGWGVTVVKL